MDTRDDLVDRIREALRTDSTFLQGIVDLDAADETMRRLARNYYLGKHGRQLREADADAAGTTDDAQITEYLKDSANESAPADADAAQLVHDARLIDIEAQSQAEINAGLTAELEEAAERLRATSKRLRRCRRWLVAVSILLVLAAAGGGYATYLAATRN